MARRWTKDALDELAREHVVYEVRKLTEYVIELDRLPPVDKWIEQGHGAVGQALLEATLIHIRNLGVSSASTTGEQDAHATHYAKWSTDSFLDGPGYGRLTAKVAHLNHSRLRSKLDDWQPTEVLSLARECLEQMQEFFDELVPEWMDDAFARNRRDHVEQFLTTNEPRA